MIYLLLALNFGRAAAQADRPRLARSLPFNKTVATTLALPSPFFPRHTFPPLHHGDVALFSAIVNQVTKHNGYRMLIVGASHGWIKSLREADVHAFGIFQWPHTRLMVPRLVSDYVIGEYEHMPFRTSRFKAIVLTAIATKDLLFEIDRLLVPEGWFILVHHEVVRCAPFLHYFRYEYVGKLANGMSIYQKHDRGERSA